MVIGVVSDSLGNQRRRAHAFERGDTPGTLLRPVHTARIELYDAALVRQTTVANPGLGGIVFRDVHPGNHRVEHILALGDHLERFLDRVHRAAVAVAEAAVVGNNHRWCTLRGKHLRASGGGWLRNVMLAGSSRKG